MYFCDVIFKLLKWFISFLFSSLLIITLDLLKILHFCIFSVFYFSFIYRKLIIPSVFVFKLSLFIFSHVHVVFMFLTVLCLSQEVSESGFEKNDASLFYFPISSSYAILYSVALVYHILIRMVCCVSTHKIKYLNL